MLAHWIRQEEIKEARKQGWIEGYAKDFAEGYAKGRAQVRLEVQAEVRLEGYPDGRLKGYAKGYVEGRAMERKVWQEWRRSLEAWEQRKTDAKNTGQQFNEPRPKPPADD